MSKSWCRTLCVLLLLAASAGAAERGFPLITVYPPETHKAGPQTFDITQDARGILHFGNLHGLVTFDGAWWELTTLPNEQVALSLASDSKGRMAVGLINDFGYLAPDAEGARKYHSLLGALPADQRDLEDVRSICPTPAGFLFVAEKGLLLWDGGTVKQIARFSTPDAPRGCSAHGADVLLGGPKGLQRLDLETLQIRPAGIDNRMSQIIRRTDGTAIAVTREEGLFVVDRSSGAVTPFAPAVRAWLVGKLVTGSARLRDGRMVLTTRQHGLIIFNDDGEIETTIDAQSGLPDAVLSKAFVDREGSLWLAMEGPIVRIDLTAPVTVFDNRGGLRGSVGDVARFDGKLYTATTHGLFMIDESGKASRVEPTQENVWRLLVVDDELLVGNSKGIFRIRAGGAVEQILKFERELYDMSRSPSDPDRIWIGHGDGVASMRRVNGVWIYGGLLPGIDHEINSVLERDGVLWCGTVFDGIVQVLDPRGANPRIRRYGTNEMNVFDVDGKPVFVRANGDVLQIGRKGQLERDSRLGHLSAPRGFFVLAQDTKKNIWINSTPPRVFGRQSDGTYAREGSPLVSVTAADIQNIRPSRDGVVWFGSDKGLFRYDSSASAEIFAGQPTPLLRRVTQGESRVLFRGEAEQQSTVALKHNFGRIRVEFAPASYRPGVEYQYRLDPIDEVWSEWTAQPFIDYTTLAAGDYTLRLRARGAGSLPSAETQWRFSVLPPWYLTRWAYGLWILLGVAIVLAMIRFRTGALRRQAEKLRARVAEQTAELQEAVRLLEDANTRLEALSFEDDLTGIANRRYFERTLADEWNRAKRHELPLALILLDLDHFKDLNDRRGHPAGDECLRRVGAFLSEAVRRSGEVVARFGGEEFAILLPGTDNGGAIRVAETLRDGIERLGIPYGGTSVKRVTASCGVASIVPHHDANAQTLVASADRALYAAKHSGRNRVSVADESTTGTWLHASA